MLRGQLAAISGERAIVGFAMASFLLDDDAAAASPSALLPRGTKQLRLRVRCPLPPASEGHRVVYTLLVEAAPLPGDAARAARGASDSALGLRSFHLDFTLPAAGSGQWTELVAPLAALRPNFRGRTVEGAPPPAAAEVRALGVAVLRSRQAEPARPGTQTEFALEVKDGCFEMLG